MAEKVAVHEPSTHEPELGSSKEISARLESEKHWFAVTTKKGSIISGPIFIIF
jgi:hypothetical protein